MSSNNYETTNHPRLGRWLVWLCYLLIGTALFSLASLAIGIYDLHLQVTDLDTVIKPVLKVYLPPMLAAVSPGLAGLALLAWRRAAGFKLALVFIWLAPAIAIAQEIGFYGFYRDPALAAGELLLDILHAGVFHAAGCTAFLLGVPRLREAYGIATGQDRPVLPPSVLGFKPSWLGVLCLFLCLPCLTILPQGDAQFGNTILRWGSLVLPRQIVNLAISAPLLVGAILLAKYRRWRQVQTAITLLWLTVLVLLVAEVLPGSPGRVSVWQYASLVFRYFGFNLITAFSWTAYLLTAPRVQAMYPRPIEEVDVEAF